MKVTLSQIWNSWQLLAKIANLELPARKAYAFARFMKDAGAEYELAEKQRVKCVERYGAKDESGNTTVPAEYIGAFTTEFNELLATEVEVYDPGLTLDDLADVRLSAITLLNLTWLIERDAKTPAEEAERAVAAPV